jgi:hypothetical protein
MAEGRDAGVSLLAQPEPGWTRLDPTRKGKARDYMTRPQAVYCLFLRQSGQPQGHCYASWIPLLLERFSLIGAWSHLICITSTRISGQTYAGDRRNLHWHCGSANNSAET